MLCSEEIFNSGGNERTIPGVPQKEGESSAWPGVLEDRSRVGPFLADRRGRHCSAGASNGARCWWGGRAGPRPRGWEHPVRAPAQRLQPVRHWGGAPCGLRHGPAHPAVHPRLCQLRERGVPPGESVHMRVCVCVRARAFVCLGDGVGGGGAVCRGRLQSWRGFCLCSVTHNTPRNTIAKLGWVAQLNNDFFHPTFKVSRGGLEFEHFGHF